MFYLGYIFNSVKSALFSLNPFMGNMLLVAILSCSVPYLEAGTLSSGDVTALLLYGTFSGIALASFGNFWASMNKVRDVWTVPNVSPGRTLKYNILPVKEIFKVQGILVVVSPSKILI